MAVNRSHGKTKTREYRIWSGMKRRCFKKDDPKYRLYGGRGIRVCERWMKFENFIADMGKAPSAIHSIDRIDNDGNYEPGNCRWATPKEQAANRRGLRLITHNGKTMTLSDWARELGMGLVTLADRLDTGWSVERAMTEPVRDVQKARNSTGFRGVFKRGKRFQAALTIKDKQHYFGMYDTAEEAARAVDAGVIRVRGKDARTNF